MEIECSWDCFFPTADSTVVDIVNAKKDLHRSFIHSAANSPTYERSSTITARKHKS